MMKILSYFNTISLLIFCTIQHYIYETIYADTNKFPFSFNLKPDILAKIRFFKIQNQFDKRFDFQIKNSFKTSLQANRFD